MDEKRCQHDWTEEKNYVRCLKCGKHSLALKKVNQDLSIGVRKNGNKYTVRNDRHRYFFPNEWQEFYGLLKKDKHKLLFASCLFTGGRIMEVLHLKVEDFDFDRGTVTFRVIKQRKAKRNFAGLGKKRTFMVSPNYLKQVKQYIKKAQLSAHNYLFLEKKNLPENYEDLPNSQKKKYYETAKKTYSRIFKRKMQKTKIKDWYNFSLHNIRKTYGNWMRAFIGSVPEITITELCYRLGHDLQTYQDHYGSPLIFTQQDKLEIIKIFGEIK